MAQAHTRHAIKSKKLTKITASKKNKQKKNISRDEKNSIDIFSWYFLINWI